MEDKALRWANEPREKIPNFLQLLHAVDIFPRGGLYSGYYAAQAALRYEKHWCKLLAAPNGRRTALPPLDVAYAWLVHRQHPSAYKVDTAARGVVRRHPLKTQAFGFSVDAVDRTAWQRVAGSGAAMWPPPAPGSAHDVAAELAADAADAAAAAAAGSGSVEGGGGSSGKAGFEGGGGGGGSRAQFVEYMVCALPRLSWQLHTWLRPQFLDPAFLQRAARRYARFLALHAAHPEVLLVPAADVALLWHTHLGLSDKYEEMCDKLFGGRNTAAAGGGASSSAAAAEEPLWRLLLWGPTSPTGSSPGGGGGGGGAAGQAAAPAAASAVAPVASEKAAAAATTADAKLERQQQQSKPSQQLPPLAATAAAASSSRPAAATPPATAADSVLFNPDYLALSPAKRAEAYGKTAALYTEMYGEPYDDADTAWIGPEVPYPLAAPYSPIAPLLRALDDNPQQAEQQGAMEAAAKQLGVRFPAPHAQVQRSGAHALYVAWLAGRRADECFNSSTCGGRCMASSSRTHSHTISHAVAAVVSCAFFLDLPVSLQHPYIRSIKLNHGAWQPPPIGPMAAVSMPAAAAAALGYSSADPWLLLAPAQRYPLDGLQLLLDACEAAARAAFTAAAAGSTAATATATATVSRKQSFQRASSSAMTGGSSSKDGGGGGSSSSKGGADAGDGKRRWSWRFNSSLSSSFGGGAPRDRRPSDGGASSDRSSNSGGALIKGGGGGGGSSMAGRVAAANVLAAAAARLDPELVNPLWAILLTRPGMAAEMQSTFYAAWAEAASRGVAAMQHTFQRQSVRPAADGVAYYGPTDYYVTTALYYQGAGMYNVGFDTCHPVDGGCGGAQHGGGGADGGGWGWFGGGDGGGGAGCGGAAGCGGGGGGCGGGGCGGA
ncbi:hypothetical protein HXX76_009164 [Chlamydomonas incerta]|uniref:Uncharacterized protein n=1 Tax=Chlamydomonas incerta TaxID=51695 RepID=A0A835T621_CHLIN|nr:hypothetical protein HXX76_009164 [Chlamydomonas incerta]|eukprot:KAG2432246.1 hypothetical protein HXX76_009164 [Chlamydomonas incerta]